VGPAGRSRAASASPGAGAEPRAAARQIAYRTRAARSPLLLPTRTLRAISATATQGLPFRDGPRERHDRPRGREHLLLRNLHSLAGGMGGEERYAPAHSEEGRSMATRTFTAILGRQGVRNAVRSGPWADFASSPGTKSGASWKLRGEPALLPPADERAGAPSDPTFPNWFAPPGGGRPQWNVRGWRCSRCYE
jgi:hypothetical protein